MALSLPGFFLLTCGCVTLAGWLVARFPQRAPTGIPSISAALVSAFVVVANLPLATGVLANSLGPVVTLICVVLPAGVYLFVTTGWMFVFVLRELSH